MAATLMSGDESGDTEGRGYNLANLALLAVRGDPALRDRAGATIRYLRS